LLKQHQIKHYLDLDFFFGIYNNNSSFSFSVVDPKKGSLSNIKHFSGYSSYHQTPAFTWDSKNKLYFVQAYFKTHNHNALLTIDSNGNLKNSVSQTLDVQSIQFDSDHQKMYAFVNTKNGVQFGVLDVVLGPFTIWSHFQKDLVVREASTYVNSTYYQIVANRTDPLLPSFLLTYNINAKNYTIKQVSPRGFSVRSIFPQFTPEGTFFYIIAQTGKYPMWRDYLALLDPVSANIEFLGPSPIMGYGSPLQLSTGTICNQSFVTVMMVQSNLKLTNKTAIVSINLESGFAEYFPIMDPQSNTPQFLACLK